MAFKHILRSLLIILVVIFAIGCSESDSPDNNITSDNSNIGSESPDSNTISDNSNSGSESPDSNTTSDNSNSESESPDSNTTSDNSNGESESPDSNSTSSTSNETTPDASANNITVKSSSVITDFRSFLEDESISAGAIAVSYNGDMIDSEGVEREASDNAPIASLSKAVTAVCTMKALTAGNFQPSATLQEVMPAVLAGMEVSDTRLQNISIEQLLTHNSGLHTAHVSVLGGDIPTMRLEQKLWQFEFIARDGLAAAPGSGYFYANSNYLILGLVIESLVQEDYESYCKREIFEPLGVESAELSVEWTLLSSFGGWDISANDYLKFINAYFTPESMLGADPATIMYTAINESTRYSLGTFMRLTSSGAQYWHSGSFTWRSPAQSGRFGAYFAVYPSGFSVSVNLSEDLNDGRFEALDSLLYQLAQ